eukprot:1161212-Pelagomonas_calceolata.AAC.1
MPQAALPVRDADTSVQEDDVAPFFPDPNAGTQADTILAKLSSAQDGSLQGGGITGPAAAAAAAAQPGHFLPGDVDKAPLEVLRRRSTGEKAGQHTAVVEDKAGGEHHAEAERKAGGEHTTAVEHRAEAENTAGGQHKAGGEHKPGGERAYVQKGSHLRSCACLTVFGQEECTTSQLLAVCGESLMPEGVPCIQ